LSDEGLHLLELLLALEQVGLVEHDDDLLAPVADALQEDALAFGEGPVSGGDEQDQVGARHKLGGDGFVLADNGVGARGVHDADLDQQLGRQGQDVLVLVDDGSLLVLAKAQQVDLGSGGVTPSLSSF
jgi:hypothetical protein